MNFFARVRFLTETAIETALKAPGGLKAGVSSLIEKAASNALEGRVELEDFEKWLATMRGRRYTKLFTVGQADESAYLAYLCQSDTPTVEIERFGGAIEAYHTLERLAFSARHGERSGGRPLLMDFSEANNLKEDGHGGFTRLGSHFIRPERVPYDKNWRRLHSA